MDLNTLQVWIHMFVNNEEKVMLDDFEIWLLEHCDYPTICYFLWWMM
jgi:hypothetical protein